MQRPTHYRQRQHSKSEKSRHPVMMPAGLNKVKPSAKRKARSKGTSFKKERYRVAEKSGLETGATQVRVYLLRV